jgi:hypothetical protein
MVTGTTAPAVVPKGLVVVFQYQVLPPPLTLFAALNPAAELRVKVTPFTVTDEKFESLLAIVSADPLCSAN